MNAIPQPAPFEQRSTDLQLENTNEAFAFLSLPRELRDEIFRYACGGQNLCIGDLYECPNPNRFWISTIQNDKNRSNLHNILMVSRQVYAEAVRILFRTSVFIFVGSLGMETSCTSMLAKHLTHIRTIRLIRGIVWKDCPEKNVSEQFSQIFQHMPGLTHNSPFNEYCSLHEPGSAPGRTY